MGEREYDEKVPVLKTGMQDIAMNEKDSIHVYFSQVCSGEDRHAGHQQCRSCYCNNEDSLVGTVITAAENKIPMLESSIGEGANLRNNSMQTSSSTSPTVQRPRTLSPRQLRSATRTLRL